MKNIEKLKQMTSEEIAELLTEDLDHTCCCNVCWYYHNDCCCDLCRVGIKTWLEDTVQDKGEIKWTM